MSSSSQLYKQIRQQQQQASSPDADGTIAPPACVIDASFGAIVDGRPYCPLLWVTVPPPSDDPTDPADQRLFLRSIKMVVARLLLGVPPTSMSSPFNMWRDEEWQHWSVTNISGTYDRPTLFGSKNRTGVHTHCGTIFESIFHSISLIFHPSIIYG